MINSKLLYLIPVFLFITFSCNDDDNASNNSCDGHFEYRVNGVFREANCNLNEEGYGSDDIVIYGQEVTSLTPTKNDYNFVARESVGLNAFFQIDFCTDNLLTQPLSFTTDFPNNLQSGQRITFMSFDDLDPDTPFHLGLVNTLFALEGSYVTININEVDGRYISGTFSGVIIHENLVTNQITTYEITDGIFENVYLELV